MTAPAGKPVSVTAWAELASKKYEIRKIPASARALRVLAGGQHAGAVWHEDGTWHAQAHGLKPGPVSDHQDAAEAVTALLRSAWARRLGARAGSAVFWSAKANRAASRTAGAR